MTRAKLKPAEAEAVLENILDRQNCSNGCDCIFCRIWEEGRQCGVEEAQVEFERALKTLRRAA